MKTITFRIVAVLALLVPALLLPTSAQAAPYCGIRWGSLEKPATWTVTPYADGHVTDVRAGRHTCYDRLVIDVDGSFQGYLVRYVDQVHASGSGFVVPTAGGARLEVMAVAPSYDDRYEPTFVPDEDEVVDVSGFRTFRQVTWAGSYEGYTHLGLGVRARLPMRAFVLDGPGEGARLVVDVAHRW